MADNKGKFKSQQALLKLAQDQELSEAKILNIQQQVISGQIKSEAVLLRQAKLLEDKITKLDIQQKLEKNIIDTEKEILDIGDQIQKQQANIVDTKQADLDTTAELVKKAKKQLNEQVKLGLIAPDIAGHLTNELDIREKALKATYSATQAAGPYGEALMSAMDGAKSSADEFLGSLPGGSALANMLGFDKAFDQLKNGAKAAMGAVVQSLLAGQGPMAALKAGQAAFNSVAMMNPYVAIAAALLIVIGLLAQQNKAIREQAKTAGVSLAVAKQQVVAAKQQVSAGNTLVANTEDVLTAQNAVNKALGTALAINAANAAAVADVGESMGYGAQVAGESAAAMIQMGVAQADVADMQMETNLMAVKAGVDMASVQADIAANAGKTSKYFAGNPKALAKAAVEAAKMGMSLSDMADISDNLLDFEKSISAQFELQSLTGKQMNFDKARQLALEGDIAGASAAVLEQVGDIHDFNKMDVLERKKLADATGMSVEQLQKSLTIQSMRGQLSEDELAAAQGLNLTAAEMKDLTADDLKQKLASQDATAKMAKTMNQVKEQAMMALQPLMDMIGIIFDILTPIIKIGLFINKLIMMPFKAVFSIVKMVFAEIQNALKPIFDIFSEIGNSLGGSSGGGGIMGMLQTMGGIISKFIVFPITLLANIIAAILTPVVKILSGVFSVMGDIITAIGDAITTYILTPIETAIDALANLNPLNWFGGDDEAEVKVTADGESLKSGGKVDDGVIQNGKIITTNPADTIIATKETDSLLGGLGQMAADAFAYTPMGMAANAIGGMFGGNESSNNKTEDSVSMADVIAAISNIEIQLDGKKVSAGVRVADSFRRR